MFATFATAWKLPDIRKKLLFTFMIIILFRIGCVIPVPFVDAAGLKSAFTEATNGTFFEYMNILSGDAFSRATLFALSISPYITASIIVQLLTIAIPALERMSKDENGKKKLNRNMPKLKRCTAITRLKGFFWPKICAGSVKKPL